MKKLVFFGLLAVLLATFMVSCGGGNNPKALAKQTHDLSRQALGAMFDLSKAAELEKKTAEIERKVDQLSEKDQKVYFEELAKLSGSSFGDLFNAGSNLFDAASGLVDDDSLEDALESLDTAKDTAKQAADALNTAKDAMDTAKQAANALKAFGF